MRPVRHSGPYDYWAIEYGYKPIAPRARGGRAGSASPRAATSRNWPTAPTRTTSSASTRSRCSSTSATTRSAFAQKRCRHRARPDPPPGVARPQAQRGLLGAAPLDELSRCATSRARRACWRARSAACARCATTQAAAATRCCRCSASGAAPGARPAGQRRAGGRQLRASRRRCSARMAPDLPGARATRCSAARPVATDYLAGQRGDRDAARVLGLADERQRGAAPARQRGQGRRQRPGAALVRAVTALRTARSGASCVPAAATSLRCAASCSANTSTGMAGLLLQPAALSRADARSPGARAVAGAAWRASRRRRSARA